MTKKLFTLQYQPDGEGSPHHMSENVKPDQWEWDNYPVNPFELVIKNHYEITITDPEITSVDFDFYGNITAYTSQDFLTVCNSLGVSYRAVPVDLRLAGGTAVMKTYSIFLPGDYMSLLDADRSEAEIELVVETGEPMSNSILPATPMYSKISKFVALQIDLPELFFCVDIFCLVCTDDFRKAVLAANLRGIGFMPLDDAYVYDPWADW